jgi:hypothetical protein
MANKAQLIEIANMILSIDHVGVQVDDIHHCEHKHQTIMALDKLDKHEAIRLLMHVIHVQQLQLAGAAVKHDPLNPFKDMVDFKYIHRYLKENSPKMASLY